MENPDYKEIIIKLIKTCGAITWPVMERKQKKGRGWGRTKSEKRREVTNTGGGGQRVGNPLPTMCSECKEIVFYKDK